MPKRKAVRSKKGASIKKGSTSNSDIVTNTSEDTLSSPAQEREETLNESIEKQEDIAAEGNLRQEVCLKTSCDGTEVTTSVVLPNQIESNDTIHDVTERVNPQNTEAEEKCEPAEHTGSQESEKNAAECELDFCEVKGAEDDDDEVQYIDEEAEEEQQLTGVMESSTGDKGSHINDMPNTELDLSTNISDESKTEKSILVKFSDSAAKAATLEAESSKFEEISEGSIDQTEQDDLINEESADVEITGVSFNSKENISQFPQSDFQLVKSHVPYSAAESLEEVFFATENDDLKIPAEDKDNDDISDSSFSDNGRTNLSLEEISDDDLEPSKKRRKSVGLMHQKRENISDTKRSLRDIQSKTEPKLLKGNEISEDSNKRLASAEEDEARITKRLKLSEEKDAAPVNDLSLAKNDVEVNVEQVKERNSVDLKLKTENLDKTDEISSSAVFGGKSKKDDKSPTEVSKYGGKITAQTSKHDHYDGKDKIPSGRDYIEPRRRYELIHSSTQTEAKVLKGKIVQCNINPIDQYFESVKLFGAMEGKFECSKLLKKFKHLLPSSIPVKIFTDITSVKPATKVHNYTFSMGPVTMSDMDSHEFRDVAVKGAERFHLAFDTYCQGIFQCTISKYENIASLIKSLKGLELGNRYMCMSFTYNLGTDKENDVWKATLLYMYEQDIHTESISLISDEKIRSKLLLHGLPSGVSKDFINLLFPEALSVNTISGVNEERVVALGFSNTKMVEEILTCYDLVIVNGCQVKITQVELNDTSCEAESADVIIIDEDSSVCKLLPKDKEVMYSDRSADAHKVSEKRTESRHTLTDNDILKDRISQDGDQTNELVEENVILENSHAQIVKEIVHLHQAETNVALMSSDLNSSADRKLEDTQDVDQPKVTSDEGNEAQRDISDKCEISTLSSGLGEVEKETSLIDEAPKPAADDKPTEVFSDSTDVETDTKDIHLEDVSDDDMMNQSKTTVDNFVMIKEEPHIVVNIDLTNDDSESSVNNTSSLKNSKAHDTILPGEAAMNSAFTKGEDEKLVMTDGRLHVSMEVIDVSEDESSEKIIYSKYTRASSKKAKRILKERSGEHSIAQHWENDPWKRHEHKRYDAYSSQRETYSKHPPKDYPARKSPHYQRSHSGDISQNKKMLSLRESSPRHRVPNRESTAVRREKFHHDVRVSGHLYRKNQLL
ncbi:hypothetical protein Btru_024773 [Bulinus truncatus]|nr:hypothetical protein Btru_024773 [Bulinus truncatus]